MVTRRAPGQIAVTGGRVVGLASHVIAAVSRAAAGEMVARLVVATGLVVKSVTVATGMVALVDPGVLRPTDTLQVGTLLTEEENPLFLQRGLDLR